MKIKINILIPLLAVFIAGFIVTGANDLYARDSKDVILVLDTSLSMKGYGGKDIFNRVTKSISDYIDSLEDGDRITFVTFDTKVKFWPTVMVDDQNDRDIVKKYISTMEAKGLWTYTYNMIYEVYKKADELEKDDEDMQTLIVIMTDNLDDPPPGQRADRLYVKDVSSRVSQRERWVYYIDFSDMKDNKRLAAIRKRLEKGATYVKVIEGKENPGKAIDQDFRGDVAAQDAKQTNWPLIIIIILVCAILLLFLIFFLLKGKQKVSGKLEYWKMGVINAYTNTIDMADKGVHEFTIGKSPSCTLNIRDIDIHSPISIVAVKEKGVKKLQLETSETPIEFINKSGSEFLEDGDIFQAGNYSFKFFSE